MRADELLKLTDNFLSMAENIDDPTGEDVVDLVQSNEPKDKQKSQSETRKKWFQNLMERGKADPNDPKYQDYLNRRRQQYLSDKLKRQEAPWQETEEHRAKLRERQQRFQEKLDPTKKQEQLKQQWVEKKQQMQSDNLEGLSIKLRQQIAETKRDLDRSDNQNKNQNKSSDFLITLPKLYALREQLKFVLHAKPNAKELIRILDDTNTCIFMVSGKNKSIENTLIRIKTKLEELL